MPSALLFIGGALALVLARLFYYHVIKAIFSPLRDLPGPVSKGIFKTHLKHAMEYVDLQYESFLLEIVDLSFSGIHVVLEYQLLRKRSGIADSALTIASKASTGYIAIHSYVSNLHILMINTFSLIIDCSQWTHSL